MLYFLTYGLGNHTTAPRPTRETIALLFLPHVIMPNLTQPDIVKLSFTSRTFPCFFSKFYFSFLPHLTLPNVTFLHINLTKILNIALFYLCLNSFFCFDCLIYFFYLTLASFAILYITLQHFTFPLVLCLLSPNFFCLTLSFASFHIVMSCSFITSRNFTMLFFALHKVSL